MLVVYFKTLQQNQKEELNMKHHKKSNLDISLKVPGVEATVKQRMSNLKETVTEEQVKETAAILSEFAPKDTKVAGITENVQYDYDVEDPDAEGSEA